MNESQIERGEGKNLILPSKPLNPALLHVNVLYHGEGKWPRRVRWLLLALADPTRRIEEDYLDETLIAMEVAEIKKKCREERISGDHLCVGCGWSEEEMKRIEMRASIALKVLPNPISKKTSHVQKGVLEGEKSREKKVKGEMKEELPQRAINPSMAISEANFLVSECFAVVLKEGERRMNEKKGVNGNTSCIDLIGSHGQTVWHHPSPQWLIPYNHQEEQEGKKGKQEYSSPSSASSSTHQTDRRQSNLGRISSTLQIGEGPVLANRMGGVSVVSSFRSGDVSQGGQGAPLTSSLDIFLLSHLSCSSSGEGHWVALQNLGGMGNVSIIPPSFSPQLFWHDDDTGANLVGCGVGPNDSKDDFEMDSKKYNQISEEEKLKNSSIESTNSKSDGPKSEGPKSDGPKSEDPTSQPVQSPNPTSFIPIAFDTGPANVLLDWFMSHVNPSLMYDANGEFASQGKSNSLLLLHFLSHPYFSLPPPKTCGREVFTAELGLQWLEESRKTQIYGSLSPSDFMASLVDLTASSLILSLLRFTNYHPQLGHLEESKNDSTTLPSLTSAPISQPKAPFPTKIILAGGGSHNSHLKSRIEYFAKRAITGDLASLESHVYGNCSKSSYLQSLWKEGNEVPRVYTSVEEAENDVSPSSQSSQPSQHASSKKDSVHFTPISADSKESVLFAVLAFLTLHGIPSSIPSCTGAKESTILGSISPSLNFRKLMAHIFRS